MTNMAIQIGSIAPKLVTFDRVHWSVAERVIVGQNSFWKKAGVCSMYFDILERIRFIKRNDFNMRYEDKWV